MSDIRYNERALAYFESLRVTVHQLFPRLAYGQLRLVCNRISNMARKHKTDVYGIAVSSDGVEFKGSSGSRFSYYDFLVSQAGVQTRVYVRVYREM